MSGKIDGHAEPDTRWNGISTVRVEAGRGFGYVAAAAATDALVDALDRSPVQGEAIPGDWALDCAGAPTTDPIAAMAGSLQAIGGHKGIVMAMLLHLLVAVTTSSALPGDTPSTFTPDRPPPRLGHVLLGLNPAALGVGDAASRVDRYIEALLADTDALRVPGARRREARARAQVEGVVVPDWLLDDLRDRIQGTRAGG